MAVKNKAFLMAAGLLAVLPVAGALAQGEIIKYNNAANSFDVPLEHDAQMDVINGGVTARGFIAPRANPADPFRITVIFDKKAADTKKTEEVSIAYYEFGQTPHTPMQVGGGGSILATTDDQNTIESAHYHACRFATTREIPARPFFADRSLKPYLSKPERQDFYKRHCAGVLFAMRW